MCVAVLTTRGKVLTNDQLWKGWTINGDGAGFAYVKDDAVVIEKGFMNYNSFQSAYALAAEQFAEDSPFLIHMRIRTSGNTNANNCHPFPIKGGALIHNGIMFTPSGERAGKDPTDRKSDTRVFAESLYNILVLEDVKRAQEGIRKAIGYGNKIAMLYDSKEYVIIGESAGMWVDGIWYSNSSCGLPKTAKEK